LANALSTNEHGAVDVDGHALLNTTAEPGINLGCGCCGTVPHPAECCGPFAPTPTEADPTPADRFCGQSGVAHTFRLSQWSMTTDETTESFTQYTLNHVNGPTDGQCAVGASPCVSFQTRTLNRVRFTYTQVGEFFKRNATGCCQDFCVILHVVEERDTVVTDVPDVFAGCAPRTVIDRHTRREYDQIVSPIPPLVSCEPLHPPEWRTTCSRNSCCWPLPGRFGDTFFVEGTVLPSSGPTPVVVSNLGSAIRTVTSSTFHNATKHQVQEGYNQNLHDVGVAQETIPNGHYQVLICTDSLGGLRERVAYYDVSKPQGWFTHTSLKTGFVNIEHGWERDCDGAPAFMLTPGPGASDCSEIPPPTTLYRLGDQCSSELGVAPEFALPAANVRGCGIVKFGPWCYRFDSTSPLILNLPPGTTIGTDVVDQKTNKLCCECQDECDKTAITQDPQWLNAVRDQLTGAYRISPNPVMASSKCCCAPDDVFTLVYANSRFDRVFHDDGTPWVWETFTAVPFVPFNWPTNDDGSFAPSIMRGVRRNVQRAGVGFRLIEWADGVPGTPIQIQANTFCGPVACEWHEGSCGFPVSEVGFAKPLHINAMHPQGVQPPCPTPFEDTDGDGEHNGWRIIRYVLTATCQTLQAEGVWERYNGATVVNRVSANALWTVRQPNANRVGCSGGCQPPVAQPIPVAGNPATFDTNNEQIVRALTARQGCGSCGQTGGL